MCPEFDQIQKDIEAYPRFRKAPGFTAVKALLANIGYKDSIPMIHVVGTNGKGSVASMVGSMLVEHQIRVGLFTSPHLVDVRERMVVNGALMTKESFVRHYKYLMSLVDAQLIEGGERPTFFECMFLLAILHFIDEQVEVMVMEAGIGGRLDTTNVLENRWLNIITSISLDHTSVLGTTIEAIVDEKAAIIRPNVKTVILDTSKAVTQRIQRIGREKMGIIVPVAPFDGIILERDKECIDFSLDTKYYSYERLSIGSSADYQLDNAKLAIIAIHALAEHITVDPSRVRKGLSQFRWPGRMEYITPWLLVDGAHNTAGMIQFVKHLNYYENRATTDLLFACMSDKDYEEMCSVIAKIEKIGTIYLPQLPYLRAIEPSVITSIFKTYGIKTVVVDDLNEFLDTRESKVGVRTLLGAIGSLYLVGAIKKYSGGPDNDQF